jgi:Kef-type K+ transport system membrane component KefB
MHEQPFVLILTVGLILLVGMVTEFISRGIRIPRVTILILCGVFIGPSMLDLLPSASRHWHVVVSQIALLMVGFLLGGKLSIVSMRQYGRQVLWISVFEVLGVSAVVLAGLMLCGVRTELALLLAGIAPASAPAAITNVVEETRAKGRFTDTLLGIVAIDDAWGLVIFSLMLAGASMVSGSGGVIAGLLLGGRELGGALLIGVLLGVPFTWLANRIRAQEPMQAEALGFVLVCGGMAVWIGASYLLAAMLMGMVVTNHARSDASFESIRQLEWPIMILFFVLAGASLDTGKLPEIGLIGLLYILLRMAGLMGGAWIGGSLSRASATVKRWMGLALMPQAGVALGMALVAGNRFPQVKDAILPLIIGTTVVFEIVGPVLARISLNRSGEAEREGEQEEGGAP